MFFEEVQAACDSDEGLPDLAWVPHAAHVEAFCNLIAQGHPVFIILHFFLVGHAAPVGEGVVIVIADFAGGPVQTEPEVSLQVVQSVGAQAQMRHVVVVVAVGDFPLLNMAMGRMMSLLMTIT
jgi:hypothetical protein